MSDQSPLEFPPLQYNEFHQLPAGFEYPHPKHAVAFDTGVDTRDCHRCVVCGRSSRGGPHPGVQRAHIIGRTEYALWDILKDRYHFVPHFAKSVENEPRNGISLCDLHHSDFDAYSFFIRWVPSLQVFVLINFSQEQPLEEYHGKIIALNPKHFLSPFPALFLIQEMRTRGYHPWHTDRPIPQPLSHTYAHDSGSAGDCKVGLGSGSSDTGVGFGGSSGMAGPSGHSKMASSSSGGPGLPSTGTNQPSSAKRTTSVFSKVLKVSKSAFLRKKSPPL